MMRMGGAIRLSRFRDEEGLTFGQGLLATPPILGRQLSLGTPRIIFHLLRKEWGVASQGLALPFFGKPGKYPLSLT